jgi:hypothetical protein
MAHTKGTKFPDFFPVSRESGVEKSSHETASTATQSGKFALFQFLSEKVWFQFQFPRLTPRSRLRPTRGRQVKVRRRKILRLSRRWLARMDQPPESNVHLRAGETSGAGHFRLSDARERSLI